MLLARFRKYIDYIEVIKFLIKKKTHTHTQTVGRRKVIWYIRETLRQFNIHSSMSFSRPIKKVSITLL